MKLVRTQRVISRLAACFLIVSTVTLSSLAESSDTGATLWVGESKGLYAISSDTGEQHSENLLANGATGVATNSLTGDVWVYSNRSLYQYSASGTPLQSFSTPIPLLQGAPAGMIVDGQSGVLWLAFGTQLYRFDLQGTLEGTTTLNAPVVAMTLDRFESILWVAHRSQVVAYDLNGTRLDDLDLSASPLGNETVCTLQAGVIGALLPGLFPPQCVYGLSYDPLTRGLWVSLTNRVQRYEGTGELVVDWPRDVRGPVEADGAGGLWMAKQSRLIHISPDGDIDQNVSPFSILDGSTLISGLAADPLGTTAWVTNERLLKHYDLGGQLLHRLQPSVGSGIIHKIMQMSLHADTTAPEFSIVAPEGGSLHTQPPVIRLAITDSGNNVNVGSMKLKVNGAPFPASCTQTSEGADCFLNGTLPQGEIDLEVRVSDYVGNISPPVNVVFTFDSVAPVVTLQSPEDGLITSSSTVSIIGNVDEHSRIEVDGVETTLDAALAFSFSKQLDEGQNSISVIATDQAGNISQLIANVILDTVAPAKPDVNKVVVGESIGGVVTVTGTVGAAEAGSQIFVKNVRTGEIATATVAADGSFIAQIAANVGDQLQLTSMDMAFNSSAAATVTAGGAGNQPPEISIISPIPGARLNSNPVIWLSYADDHSQIDQASIEFTVNTNPASSTCSTTHNEASCTVAAALPEGSVSLSVTVADQAGNRSNAATASFIFDSISPEIRLIQPPEAFVTNHSQISVAGDISEAGAAVINGSPAALNGNNAFGVPIELVEGANAISISATDLAGNTSSLTRLVTLDSVAPVAPAIASIEIGAPFGGVVAINGMPGSAEPGSTIRVRNVRTGEAIETIVDTDGSFTVQIPAVAEDELEIVSVDVAGNVSEVTTATVGEVPAGVTILEPNADALLNVTPAVRLAFHDAIRTANLSSIRIAINDQIVPSQCGSTQGGAHCTLTSELPDGFKNMIVSVDDLEGAPFEPASVQFTIDATAPEMYVDYPSEETSFTNQAELTVFGVVLEEAAVRVNGVPATIYSYEDYHEFSAPVVLVEGTNLIRITGSDHAGNEAVIERAITLDSVPPGNIDPNQLTIGESSNGTVMVSGRIDGAEPGLRAHVRNRRTGQVFTAEIGADGSFVAQALALPGDELEIVVLDAADNASDTLDRTVANDSGLPYDPVFAAPPLAKNEVMQFGESVAFLFTGGNVIQTGVTPGAIENRRAAVVRGRVLDRDGAPVPGVSVSVKDHPELGQTLTRLDGRFDMAVNGGGALILNYVAASHLPAQRQVNTPWRDFTVVEDVVLIPVDDLVTEVNLSSPSMQVASGNPVTDAEGTRQATLVFEPGTTASMVLPNGTRQQLTQLSVRATEYTVGDSGPLAMPGELPLESGYTYAVELSVDEAMAAGAVSVEFNRPVWLYVDNFLGFDVGGVVPTGWYDRQKAAWIPSDNGRVLKVLSISGGLAALDVKGNGTVATVADYQALGVTDAERTEIAARFEPGQSFWRVGITHFTPWDCNWPVGPPEDAEEPDMPPPRTDDRLDDPDVQCGSIIDCDTQVLAERIPVAGTPFSLLHRGDRVPGRVAMYSLDIPLSGDELPQSLKRIDLLVEISGRLFRHSFPATTNRRFRFVWDGKDAYQRDIRTAVAKVSIGYVYAPVYYRPDEFPRIFAAFSSTGAVTGNNRIGSDITLWQHSSQVIGSHFVSSANMADWTLPIHHAYHPTTRTLVRGDGGQRVSESVSNVITTIAGTGVDGYSGDGGPAVQARFRNISAVDVAADGSVFVSDSGNRRVRRIHPNGIVTTVAGNGSGTLVNGAAALATGWGGISGLDVMSDGGLLLADVQYDRVYRIGTDGAFRTIAGNDSAGGFSGDGGAGTDAKLREPESVTSVADGSVYIADRANNRIRKVDPEGVISTVAGVSCCGTTANENPAKTSSIEAVVAVDASPDGSLYLLSRQMLYRIGADGFISRMTAPITIVGGFSGDGGPSVQGKLNTPRGVAVGPDGAVYIADTGNYRIRRIGTDGVITTIAGVGQELGPLGDGGSALQATIAARAVAVGPDGSLYIADANRVRRISAPLPGFSENEIAIASEDGGEMFAFSPTGRHLRTVDARTGQIKYRFFYDDAGNLNSILDHAGYDTFIERDAQGRALAIVAPHGQRTALTIDASNQLVSVVSPENESWHMAYSTGGLLTRFTDPRGSESQFDYDDQGRLIRDTNSAGGFYAFSRTEQDRGFEVTKTSAEGRVTTYGLEYLTNGDERRTKLLPDGSVEIALRTPGFSTQTTDSDGTVVTESYGPDPRFGMSTPIARALTVSTPGGRVSTTSNSRNVALTNPNDPLSLSSLTEETVLNGKTWRNIYTAATKRLVESSPTNRQVTITFDDLSRPLSRQAAGFLEVRYSYDERGRLATRSQGNGDDARVISFNYGDDGYLRTLTDADGESTTFDRDAAGRITRKLFSDGRELGLGYDQAGNLTSIKPAGRDQHVFIFDTVGNLETYTPPELTEGGTATHYLFNLDKDLVQIARPDGESVAFDYSAPGRKISAISMSDGSYTYSYTPATGKVDEVSAPGGLLLSYSYDGFLITGETLSGGVGGSVTWAYDNNLRVVQQSVNGSGVSFGYDDDGLLIGAGAMTIDRDASNGVPISTALGNIETTSVYSEFAELSDYSASFNGAILYSDEVADRDKRGRILERTEVVLGQATTYGYSYDDAGRLESVSANGSTAATYVYDANGNRLFRNTTEGQYDEQDRLLSYGNVSYEYSKAGDLESRTVGGVVSIFDYDAFGNLRKVALPGDIRIEYLIDARNRRVGKKVNDSLVQGFLYQNQINPVAELDGAGNVISHFIYAEKVNVPSYMIKSGRTFRIISDQLGSPRLIVDMSSGLVVQQMEYDEFGRVLVDTNPGFQPFGYAGGIYDLHTELVRFGSRDYDAESGRWTTKDPIGFHGGDTNLYAYVKGDPISGIDPTGLDTLIIYGFPYIGNPAGHVALAFTGAGVYSYGTREPFGSSATNYVVAQSQYRNQLLINLKTDLQQEAAMRAAMDSYRGSKYSLVSRNCATAAVDALLAGGLVGDQFSLLPPMLPQTPADIGALRPGATFHVVPTQGAFPAPLLGHFNGK